MNRSFAITIVASTCLSFSAHAALSQSAISPPGGFAQSTTYPTSNGCFAFINAGSDITQGCGVGADFHEQSFSGQSTASTSSFNNAPGANGPLTQSTSGTAGLGYARAQGSNAYTDYAGFAMTVLDAGWNESFTISHPSLNGQTGYLVFRLHAQGSFHTEGLSGSAAIEAVAYKNNTLLVMNPYYQQEGSDGSNFNFQYARWGLASFGLTENRNVDSYVTMAAPITFGTPFTLGVYARFIAGQRSSGGFNDPSRGSLNFASRGIEWAGITSIRTENGTIVNGASIVSGSGINWTPPFQACDSIDFNNDTSFFDPQDIDAFLSVYSEGPCVPSIATCNDIDFNNDGSVFDPCDIDAFLLAFSEGPCTPCGQ